MSNRNSTTRLQFLAIFAMALTLLACGGGSGEDGQNAGIEGTGSGQSGAISGFGSIFVNGIEFDTSNADIFIDGQPATESQLDIGMQVAVTSTPEANSGTQQVAARVIHLSQVAGTLQAIDAVNETVQIAGQPVHINHDTILTAANGSRIALDDLNIGDNVLCSAYIDNDANFVATYLRVQSASSSAVTLSGLVRDLNLSTSNFRINTQTVNYSGGVVDQTAAVLANQVYVQVRGTLSGTGNPVIAQNVTTIERSLGTPGSPAAITGIITLFSDTGDFRINGQPIDADAATFENTGVNAANNQIISVTGQLDSSGVLMASQARVTTSSPVRIIASVDSVTATQLVLFNQSVSTRADTFYLDRSSLGQRQFNLSAVTAGQTVYLGIFTGPENSLTAQVIERLSLTSPTESLLGGPVQSVDAGNRQIVIAGITVSIPVTAAITNEDGSAATFGDLDTSDTVTAYGSEANSILDATRVVIEQ